MPNLYKLKVFNTVTSLYEEILVTKEVYDEYRRGEWRIDKNEEKHRKNEIPFCSLIGAEDRDPLFFAEFVSHNDDPASQLASVEARRQLYDAITALSEADQSLIYALFFCGLTEKQYADKIGVKQQTIHKKKERILRSLRKRLTEI